MLSNYAIVILRPSNYVVRSFILVWNGLSIGVKRQEIYEKPSNDGIRVIKIDIKTFDWRMFLYIRAVGCIAPSTYGCVQRIGLTRTTRRNLRHISIINNLIWKSTLIMRNPWERQRFGSLNTPTTTEWVDTILLWWCNSLTSRYNLTMKREK